MDTKALLSIVSGGVGMAGPYLLGLFQNADPTSSIGTVIGGAGLVVAGLLFVVGAFGVKVAVNTEPSRK